MSIMKAVVYITYEKDLDKKEVAEVTARIQDAIAVADFSIYTAICDATSCEVKAVKESK